MGEYAWKLLEGKFQGRHTGQNSDRRGGGILVAAAIKIYLAKHNCALLIL